MASHESEILLVLSSMAYGTMNLLIDPNTWIANTGASMDSTRCIQGASKIKMLNGNYSVMGQDGSWSVIKAKADIPGCVLDMNGNPVCRVVMTEVKHVPNSKFNLFSITKRQHAGWKLGGNETAIWIKKAGNVIKFDIKINIREGMLFTAYIQQDNDEITDITHDGRPRLSVGKAHQLLDHPSNETTCKPATNLQWVLTPGPMGSANPVP